jgi:ubiquinone/menaquinone biosynthesis C-methylase UbiE
MLGSVEGHRCLEIGCGGGGLIERLLSQKAACVAALDHSPDMLALAMAHNQRAVADERLQLKLGDAAEIPWPDQTFDAAVSANMFFFIEEPQRVLDELFRVLRPGARLVIVTTPGPLPKASLRNWWLYVWGPALHVHSNAQMESMFSRAGFVNVRIESDDTLQCCQGSRPH